MKAGIYKTPNGNYVYVNTARTIKAETGRVGLVGQKPAFQNGGEAGIVGKQGESLDLRRVSDAPMGLCNGVAIMTYLDSIGVDYTTDERRPGEIMLKGPTAKLADDLKRHVVNEQAGQIIDKSPLVSPEWAKGREDKQFSRQVVYGYDAGFLSQQAAAAERWLLAHIEQLQALAAQGIVRHVAHDEWEVLDADAYAAALAALPLGTPDAILPDGTAVEFKTAQNVGKTDLQSDVYARMADQVFGVSKAMHGVGRAARKARKAFSHPALAMPYGPDIEAQYEAMRNLGYRRCHKQSARKHRRMGHIVIPGGGGTFWWTVAKAG